MSNLKNHLVFETGEQLGICCQQMAADGKLTADLSGVLDRQSLDVLCSGFDYLVFELRQNKWNDQLIADHIYTIIGHRILEQPTLEKIKYIWCVKIIAGCDLHNSSSLKHVVFFMRLLRKITSVDQAMLADEKIVRLFFKALTAINSSDYALNITDYKFFIDAVITVNNPLCFKSIKLIEAILRNMQYISPLMYAASGDLLSAHTRYTELEAQINKIDKKRKEFWILILDAKKDENPDEDKLAKLMVLENNVLSLLEILDDKKRMLQSLAPLHLWSTYIVQQMQPRIQILQLAHTASVAKEYLHYETAALQQAIEHAHMQQKRRDLIVHLQQTLISAEQFLIFLEAPHDDPQRILIEPHEFLEQYASVELLFAVWAMLYAQAREHILDYPGIVLHDLWRLIYAKIQESLRAESVTLQLVTVFLLHVDKISDQEFKQIFAEYALLRYGQDVSAHNLSLLKILSNQAEKDRLALAKQLGCYQHADAMRKIHIYDTVKMHHYIQEQAHKLQVDSIYLYVLYLEQLSEKLRLEVGEMRWVSNRVTLNALRVLQQLCQQFRQDYKANLMCAPIKKMQMMSAFKENALQCIADMNCDSLMTRAYKKIMNMLIVIVNHIGFLVQSAFNCNMPQLLGYGIFRVVNHPIVEQSHCILSHFTV